MTTVDMMFDEQEVLEEASRRWWIFLVTGIGWLVFALLVFQWDFTTVYAVSILFGCVAFAAGVNEFLQITVSTTGWKIVHGILGVLFVLGAAWAFIHPHNAFATISALIGFFFLFKGIFDLTVAFTARSQFEVWWIQLAIGIIEISPPIDLQRACGGAYPAAIYEEEGVIAAIVSAIVPFIWLHNATVLCPAGAPMGPPPMTWTACVLV